MKLLARRLRAWTRAWHLHITLPIVQLLAGSWRRTMHWCGRLQGRLFLQGLPALLAGAGLLLLTAFSLVTPAYEVEVRYLEQGRTAFQAKDYPLALTCFERVCAQNGDRQEVLYEMALTAEALGQLERATLLMRQLAPSDRQGYGEAHLWYAVRLLQGKQTKTIQKEAEAHLVRALQGELKDRDTANGLLGEVYLVTGQLDQAEDCLLMVVKSRPYLRMKLAHLYVMRKPPDPQGARKEALLAVDYFRMRSKRDLTDHYARLALGDAVTFLEKYEEAVKILEEGWTLSRKDDYRTALGHVYASWCDHQVREKKEKAEEQLALVEKGLSHDPTNANLLNRLLSVLSNKNTDPEKARQARKTLEELDAAGKGSAMAQFALGVDDLLRGKKELARKRWELALDLNKGLIDVANHLAMVLLESDPPDLPRALQLIDQVLEKAPDSPNYLDTRGRIYLKMEKWDKALHDLQKALNKSSEIPELHRRMAPELNRMLATVWRNLGDPAAAAAHELQADKQEKANKKKAAG